MEADSEYLDEDSNETHACFISILKKALQVLVPVAKLQELDKSNFRLRRTPKPETVTVDEVTNLFSHLEIQDIDKETYEKLFDVPGVSKPAGQSTGPKPIFSPDDLTKIANI